MFTHDKTGIFVEHLLKWDFLEDSNGRLSRWFSRNLNDPISYDTTLTVQIEEDAVKLLELLSNKNLNNNAYLNFLTKLGEKINYDLNKNLDWQFVPVFANFMNPEGKQKTREELEKELRAQFFKSYLFKAISVILTDKKFQQSNSDLIAKVVPNEKEREKELRELLKLAQEFSSDYYDKTFFSQKDHVIVEKSRRFNVS